MRQDRPIYEEFLWGVQGPRLMEVLINIHADEENNEFEGFLCYNNILNSQKKYKGFKVLIV